MSSMIQPKQLEDNEAADLEQADVSLAAASLVACQAVLMQAMLAMPRVAQLPASCCLTKSSSSSRNCEGSNLASKTRKLK